MKTDGDLTQDVVEDPSGSIPSSFAAVTPPFCVAPSPMLTWLPYSATQKSNYYSCVEYVRSYFHLQALSRLVQGNGIAESGRCGSLLTGSLFQNILNERFTGLVG